MKTAFELVKCDFDANCGPTNPEDMYECSMSGRCVDSFSEIVRERYEGKPQLRPDWAVVEVFRKRIFEAVSRQTPWLEVAK